MVHNLLVFNLSCIIMISADLYEHLTNYLLLSLTCSLTFIGTTYAYELISLILDDLYCSCHLKIQYKLNLVGALIYNMRKLYHDDTLSLTYVLIPLLLEHTHTPRLIVNVTLITKKIYLILSLTVIICVCRSL